MSTIKGRRRSSVPEIEKKRWEGRKEGKRLGTINKPESITETPPLVEILFRIREVLTSSPPLNSSHYIHHLLFILSFLPTDIPKRQESRD